MAPYLDEEQPIATGLGPLARCISALAENKPPPAEWIEHSRDLRELWQIMMGVELTDEHWREQGGLSNPFLDKLDEELRKLARRESEIDAGIMSTLTPEQIESNEAWKRLSRAEKTPVLTEYFAETLKLPTAAKERFDGFLRGLSFHCLEAAGGAGTAKKNDGTDLSTLMHVAHGCVLLTADTAFVRIVDNSETFQAPWVRTLTQIDALPEMVAWGEPARAVTTGFVRRSF